MESWCIFVGATVNQEIRHTISSMSRPSSLYLLIPHKMQTSCSVSSSRPNACFPRVSIWVAAPPASQERSCPSLRQRQTSDHYFLPPFFLFLATCLSTAIICSGHLTEDASLRLRRRLPRLGTRRMQNYSRPFHTRLCALEAFSRPFTTSAPTAAANGFVTSRDY